METYMEPALSDLITQDPEVLGGEAVFAGTRVPVSALFNNLRAGLPLDEILESFPTVSREAAEAVLKACQETAVRSARRVRP